MAGFTQLLRDNRNYRYTWIGQVVSEIGDHFNNIAVFSLVCSSTHSGLVVSGVMLARAIADDPRRSRRRRPARPHGPQAAS